MKILSIGSAVYDLFIEYEHPQLMAFEIDGREQMYIILEEGKKVEVKKLHPATGGGALNSAACFQRLGFSPSACSKIGDDATGKQLLALLKKKKINTDFFTMDSRKLTGTSYILPSPSGDNVILVDRAANLALAKNDIPASQFGEFDQLYITSLSGETSKLLPFITSEARKAGVPVACNPGTSQLTVNVSTLVESLENIDILILNTFEAGLLAEKIITGRRPQVPMSSEDAPDLFHDYIQCKKMFFALQHYFQAVHEHGPKIAVITNGEDGVYVSDGKNIIYHPSLPIDVTSTVGAGDAFGSTFVSQLLKKKPIEDAIRGGVINSAAVLEHLNATDGLLDQKELDELVEEIDPEGIKKFDLM